MEGQTQTEKEGDERRQERLMEVCDADRKKMCFKHKRQDGERGKFRKECYISQMINAVKGVI